MHVLVSQPEALPDPHSGLEHQDEQEAVTEVLLGVDDVRDLLDGETLRLALDGAQSAATSPRLERRDARQERAEASAPGAQRVLQPLGEIDTLEVMVLVEARDRRQSAIDRLLGARRLAAGQQQDVPGGSAHPRRELADVGRRHGPPVQVALGQEREEVLEVVGVGAQCVRRSALR